VGASVPLVVDLDGTLLKSDLLNESTSVLLAAQPWLVFRLPFWLANGKAVLKRRIAERVDLKVELLPFDREFLDWVRAQRATGRRIVLCSASDDKFVHQVADHLQLFDEVIASDGVTNMSAQRKAAALLERFGEGGFDYAGNSHDDVPVWAVARRAILVAATPRVRDAARRVKSIEQEFARTSAGARGVLYELRLHQWVKNLLVFLPLLASHRFFETPLLVSTTVGFLAFGLCASSVYVINDLVDLANDREHPRKRMRPFAAGTLSHLTGVLLSAGGLVAAFAVGSLAGAAFEAWLAIYLGMTLLYTLVLKRKILVDALALAALYTVRILAGGAAAGIWPGFWLLAFSLFLFLSLAFVKRYSELELMLREGRHATRGRDYLVSDLPLVEMFGVVSGFSAVIVMALYINGESIARLYPHQDIVWLTVPILLYWISRMWVKAHRGEMHDDPVVFAITDGLSQLCIGAFVIVMLIAGLPW